MNISNYRAIRMNPEQFFDYRSKIDVQNIEVSPGALKAVLKDGQLYLEVEGQKSDLFRIEEIFIKKLFRWFYTNIDMIPLLSAEAKLHVVNNLLDAIFRRGQKYPDNFVKLRVENGSVYSILARTYETVEDKEFFDAIKVFEIQRVEHDPYITRFITDFRLQTEAIPGDRMGYALHFTNSQTGFGALSSSIYAFRYTCSNGAVSGSRKGNFFYHGLGSFKSFRDTLSSFEDLFNEFVPEFDRNLIKARSVEYTKKLQPVIRNFIAPALTIYETKILMNNLEKCKNLWEVYDLITTIAKKNNMYEKYQLQEAAGNIITRLVMRKEEDDNEEDQ